MLNDDDEVIMPDTFYRWRTSLDCRRVLIAGSLNIRSSLWTSGAKASGNASGDKYLTFSVSNSHFHQQVKTLLEHYDIEPRQIILELTENHSLTNPEQARKTLAQLQDWAVGSRLMILAPAMPATRG